MCQGEQDAPALCLLRSNPLGTSGFTLGTSVNPARGRGWSCFFPPPTPSPAPGTAGYLRGLVRHHHALPSRHGVVHVLGEVVAFHPDEVAGWG